MKNTYEIVGDTVFISLRSKKHGDKQTIIDVGDLPKVLSYKTKWNVFYRPTTKSFYCKNNEAVYLHRFLLDAPAGMEVDHINHDTLDNRRSNLRLVTRAENKQNRKGNQSNSKTEIRGVCWHKGNEMWVARVGVNRKKILVGYFHDINEAEVAVKEARLHHLPFSNN